MALSGAPPTSSLKVVSVPAALHAISPSSASLLNSKEAARPVLTLGRRATLAVRWAEAPSTSSAASPLDNVGSLKGRAGLLERPSQYSQFDDGELRLDLGSTFRHCSEQNPGNLKATQHQELRHKMTGAFGATSLSVLLNAIQPVGSALSRTTDHVDNTISLTQATANYLLLADLEPATAKILIGITGPFLSAFGFLFIIRIVMSWYPKLPVGQFPYVVAYAPTEPILSVTRRLIPPVGGVDVTPVVWFGLLSFLNEILVGPQGLLVLLSQQVQ